MEILFDNFIGGMYGPYFLALYAAVIAVTLLVCWWVTGDGSDADTLPAVPTTPDPYEIAYLRGGAPMMTQLIVLDLIQRGYLETTDEKLLSQSSQAPDARYLSRVERRLFDQLKTPASMDDLIQDQNIGALVEGQATQYEKKLQWENLTTSQAHAQAIYNARRLGVLVIGGLGAYKLFAALSTGHYNVWFLIIMGAVGIAILYAICQPRRVSARGRAYLSSLERAYESLKRRPAEASQGFVDPATLLLFSVFGAGVLAGSPFGSYEALFQQQAANTSASTGGCGGGCGSDCGGGGCGGGCGGCGG